VHGISLNIERRLIKISQMFLTLTDFRDLDIKNELGINRTVSQLPGAFDLLADGISNLSKVEGQLSDKFNLIGPRR
jgi:hypothetical protein